MKKNELLARHGFTKITLGIFYDHNQSTKEVVKYVLNHHNIKGANEVVVNLGDIWFSRGRTKRTVQIFYK